MQHQRVSSYYLACRKPLLGGKWEAKKEQEDVMSESEHTGKLSQNKRNRTIATVCVVAAVAVAAVGGVRGLA